MKSVVLAALVGILGFTVIGGAQQTAGQLYRTIPVQGNVYMIPAAGANVAVSAGPSGVLVVDTGAESGADQLLATILEHNKRLTAQPRPFMPCIGADCQPSQWGWWSSSINTITFSPPPAKPIRYIMNTSANPNHTGGNVKISLAGVTYTGGNVTGSITDSGVGAAIVAHDLVSQHLQERNANPDSIPTDNYGTPSYKLSWFFNGEGVQMFHMPNAHSDADSFVWFRYSDVIVTGEVYNTVTYPVIDVENGGTINGVIDGLSKILDVAYKSSVLRVVLRSSPPVAGSATSAMCQTTGSCCILFAIESRT
jgi:glyoxylase-like metal-dependent hydrolase (beta-lactamase superfamily II)